MKYKPAKDISPECFLNSCHNKAIHNYKIGDIEWLVCDVHFKRFKRQGEIEKEKKKDGKK